MHFKWLEKSIQKELELLVWSQKLILWILEPMQEIWFLEMKFH